jgi:predicted nucleic acid-binding protein
LDLVGEFIDVKEIWKERFAKIVKKEHSVYDTLYVITAKRNSSLLLTNDNDLAKIRKNTSIRYLC